MGNYFNELRWKIIRANNLLQLIHQVTIEIRFRKSLAQETFKSNLEFRNQIIVSSIKFWKCFAKFMKDTISERPISFCQFNCTYIGKNNFNFISAWSEKNEFKKWSIRNFVQCMLYLDLVKGVKKVRSALYHRISNHLKRKMMLNKKKWVLSFNRSTKI